MKAFFFFLFLILFALLGCETDEAEKPQNANPRDSTGAAIKVAEANTALENILFQLINGPEPQSPSDLNFTNAYVLYREALALDSLNPTAHFGKGLLEILMLSRETAMQQIFDDWKAFFERDSMFEIELPTLMRRQPAKPTLIFSGSQLTLPVMSPLTMLKQLTDGNRITNVDPTIRDLQDFLLQHLVPRLSTAIQHLQFVANQPSFTFVVTPRMQGDPNEDAVYLDLTEVNATLSALNVLKAQLLQWCAYDLSFENYTASGMRTAFAQNSSFLSLRDGGSQRMAEAGDCWLSAIDALNRAITHLESETGNQSRHLIKIDPNDGISRADLDTLKHYLPKVRQAFVTSERFTMDADNNENTPDVTLDISMRQFFYNPVVNLKGLFPPYTVTLDTGEVTERYHRYENLSRILHFPYAGHHYWDRWVEMEYGNILQSGWDYSYPFPELDTLWNERLPDYQEYAYARLHLWLYPGFQPQGDWYNGVNFEADYDELTHRRWQPVITWDAATFQDWILPNPTINGLFPNMTDASFKQTFGIREENWQRTMVIRLWD